MRKTNVFLTVILCSLVAYFLGMWVSRQLNAPIASRTKSQPAQVKLPKHPTSPVAATQANPEAPSAVANDVPAEVPNLTGDELDRILDCIHINKSACKLSPEMAEKLYVTAKRAGSTPNDLLAFVSAAETSSGINADASLQMLIKTNRALRDEH